MRAPQGRPTVDERNRSWQLGQVETAMSCPVPRWRVDQTRGLARVGAALAVVVGRRGQRVGGGRGSRREGTNMPSKSANVKNPEQYEALSTSAGPSLASSGEPLRRRELATYLNDHLAGAEGGRRLAARLARTVPRARARRHRRGDRPRLRHVATAHGRPGRGQRPSQAARRCGGRDGQPSQAAPRLGRSARRRAAPGTGGHGGRRGRQAAAVAQPRAARTVRTTPGRAGAPRTRGPGGGAARHHRAGPPPSRPAVSVGA